MSDSPIRPLSNPITQEGISDTLQDMLTQYQVQSEKINILDQVNLYSLQEKVNGIEKNVDSLIKFKDGFIIKYVWAITGTLAAVLFSIIYKFKIL